MRDDMALEPAGAVPARRRPPRRRLDWPQGLHADPAAAERHMARYPGASPDGCPAGCATSTGTTPTSASRRSSAELVMPITRDDRLHPRLMIIILVKSAGCTPSRRLARALHRLHRRLLRADDRRRRIPRPRQQLVPPSRAEPRRRPGISARSPPTASHYGLSDPRTGMSVRQAEEENQTPAAEEATTAPPKRLLRRSARRLARQRSRRGRRRPCCCRRTARPRRPGMPNCVASQASSSQLLGGMGVMLAAIGTTIVYSLYPRKSAANGGQQLLGTSEVSPFGGVITVGNLDQLEAGQKLHNLDARPGWCGSMRRRRRTTRPRRKARSSPCITSARTSAAPCRGEATSRARIRATARLLRLVPLPLPRFHLQRRRRPRLRPRPPLHGHVCVLSITGGKMTVNTGRSRLARDNPSRAIPPIEAATAGRPRIA